MNLVLLYGGRSTEHEVSCSSATGVLAALLQIDTLQVAVVGITRDGVWHLQDSSARSREAADGAPLQIDEDDAGRVAVIPSGGLALPGGATIPCDCVLPVVHGSYGEDGTLQGMLEMADLPYVGSGVTGSAVGMDKMRSKRLWQDNGLPVVPYLHVAGRDLVGSGRMQSLQAAIDEQLGYPVFIKPNAGGSSVGISRVEEPSDLEPALRRALQVDHTVLIEQALSVREIETAVLGNDDLRAFPPGEVVPRHRFYDYEAKYSDPQGAELIIPADLPEDLAQDIMDISVSAFTAIDGSGMARVDCFVTGGITDRRVYLNEINTIPGFTPISMYPKMVAAGGVDYQELLLTLVTLARERHDRRVSRDMRAR